MRILVANNRFFPSGGPEQYLFNILPELESRGHAVIPFSLRYERNRETPYSGRFPPPPLDQFVFHADRPLSLTEKFRLARKVIRDDVVEEYARRILRDEHIDVVFALQIAHYLYPEILLAARKLGVPVVWRQSDFQILCPAYNAYRNEEPCTLCDGGLRHALYHRCMKGSLPVTTARVAAMWNARRLSAENGVFAFVCPTRFLCDRMRSAGFAEKRLRHIPTPVRRDFLESDAPVSTEETVMFVGGFYRPKGAHVALAAARGKKWRLLFVGDTDTPDGRALRKEAADSRLPNVEFVGRKDIGELKDLYRRARAVIVPSLWFENAPNVLLEAQALAKPVIASDLGSLTEMIEHGLDGLLFPPGDSSALGASVDSLMKDEALAVRLGTAARDRVRRQNTMPRHIEALERTLTEAASSRS